MNDRVERRYAGAHLRRGRGNTGTKGTKLWLGEREQSINTRNKEMAPVKSEEVLDRFLVAAHQPPLFQPPVNTDWKEAALCRFFADYTMDISNLTVNPGFLHNLSRLFNEATPQEELLVQAVRAVSLANFATESRSDYFLLKSRKPYGQSLALLKQALTDGNLTNISTLVGVLLLNMHDVRSFSSITSNKC